MANPFLDLIKNKDNAEVAEEGNSLGLGVDPTSIPLATGNTYAEIAPETAAIEAQAALAEQAKAPARAPAQAVVSPKISATPETGTETKTPQAPSIQSRLENLLEERRQAHASAEKRQGMADLIANISANLGNVVGGSQAMNTKAAVTPTQLSIKTPDIVGKVDGKYKPELDQLMAEYKSLQGANKPMTEYQRMMLQHMGKQLDQSALNSDRAMDRFNRGENRRWDNQTFTQEEKQEIAPAQAKEFAAIDKTLDSLDRIEGMNDFSTGPISGRIEKALRFAGQGSPERVALQAQLNMITSQYANAISGTAVGEGEFKRIQEQLPNENDAPQAFAAKLANFKQTMADSRYRMLDTYQQAGKNVDKLKNRKPIEQIRKEIDGETSPATSSAPHGETVERNGKMYRWNSAVGKYQLDK